VIARCGLAAIAIACAACAAEAVAPGASGASGEPLRTAVVARQAVVDRALMTGELRAAKSIALTVPRTDAWQLAIRWIAEDGALVKAGDKVLEFDNSAFTAQLAEKHLAVLEAELTLHAARDLGAIESASKATELRQREIALAKARLRAEVPADLVAGRDAQERQLERKRAEVAVAKAAHELASQREQVAIEQRIQQIALDKSRSAVAAAEKTIADLSLTAPRDGMFVIHDHEWLGRKIRLGDTVHPGMTVASLPDLGEAMTVHAELSDVDDGRVTVGMAGTCTLDSHPGDPIACKVVDITPVARSKGEGSLRRTFAAVLDLGVVDPARLRPGMSVKVELQPRTLANVLAVPRGAVLAPAQVPGEPAAPARVRLASGELRTVVLGACGAQACAIESGLTEGETVRLGGAP
jgi:biotin carboxyl carrier protein